MNYALLADGTFWLDPPASSSAHIHDFVFYILLYVMTFFFFLVIAIMLAFVVIYRRRKGQNPDDGPTHNTPLEVFWTIVPLVIVIGFFVLGLRYYVAFEATPPGADVVEVEASQWQFNFKYPNGAESNDLFLLVNRPVVLKLSSKDVTHAVYIPAFRVQRNAVPGRVIDLWFEPTEVTSADKFLHVFCTQYCGNGHAEMHSKAFVLEKKEYDAKLADAANIFVDRTTKEPLPYAKVGERLYKTMGCAQCHSISGAAGQGPTWKGLFKRDHQFAKAPPEYSLKTSDDDAKWDAYIRESILHPEAKIVFGFQNVMPPQESTLSGTPYKEKKLAAIMEFIKSNGEPQYYHPMKTPPLETPKPSADGSAKPSTDGATTPNAPSGDKSSDNSLKETPPKQPEENPGKAAEKSAEKSAEKTDAKPADLPVEPSAGKSTEKPASKADSDAKEESK